MLCAADPPNPDDGSHVTPDAMHMDEKAAAHVHEDGYYRGGISSILGDRYRVMAYLGK